VSQDGCSLTANSAPPAGCPAELRQDGNRCVVRVNSFKAIDHQGRWECFLVKTLDGGSPFANLTASMVMLREAIPKVELDVVFFEKKYFEKFEKNIIS
jgi:hypothetical protein